MKETEANDKKDQIDIHNMIAERGIFNIKGITIDPAATKADWAEIHRSVIMCVMAAKKWRQQSREFAISKWDADWTADTEVQIMMEFMHKFPDEKPQLNPDDKSVALVTIEATNASFISWERKMRDEIPTWNKANLVRALELLEPMETKAREIRGLIERLGG
jgi:hypothetical protein